MTIQTVAPVPRLAYSLIECEIATGVSKATFYRLINSGKLLTVKIGGRRLVPAPELERLCSVDNAASAA
jgi:excisionase family DNA binding protein